MKILLDHNVPRQIKRLLRGHDASTTRENGWAKLANGRLLAEAEAAGFDCLLTGDQNLAYQNNLRGRKIALVVVNTIKRRELTAQIELLIQTLGRVTAGTYSEVTLDLPPLRRRPPPAHEG